MPIKFDYAEDILYMSYNDQGSILNCGTKSGFKMFSLRPFKKIVEHEFGKGIGIVEILNTSNLIALVGGGKNPMWSPKQVMIWDDSSKKVLGELRFNKLVKGVKLTRDKVYVSTHDSIYIYHFSDLKLLDKVLTTTNNNGLMFIKQDTLLTLSLQPGHYQLYGNTGVITINRAHQNHIENMAYSQDGLWVATCSNKGTLIKIFCGNEKIYEFRRGMDYIKIVSMVFSPSKRYLAISSETSTIHIYDLEKQTKRNRYIPKLVHQYTLQQEYIFKIKKRSILSFSPDEKYLYSITQDTFIKIDFLNKNIREKPINL